MDYPLIKMIHLISVIFAVGFAMGPEILLFKATRSDDVKNIRFIFNMAEPLSRIAPLLFIIGLISGLLTAHQAGFDLLAPWLILSYIVFTITIGLDILFHLPWAKRIRIAAENSNLESPSSELKAALADRRGEITLWVGPIAIVILIGLMTLKPF